MKKKSPVKRFLDSVASEAKQTSLSNAQSGSAGRQKLTPTKEDRAYPQVPYPTRLYPNMAYPGLRNYPMGRPYPDIRLSDGTRAYGTRAYPLGRDYPFDRAYPSISKSQPTRASARAKKKTKNAE